MKTLAGWKFQGRNPASDPARIAQRSATIGWYCPTVSEMMPERDGGDERDARRQAIEPIDEVDAVDHADDPEGGDAGRDVAAELDRGRAENTPPRKSSGLLTNVIDHAQGDGQAGQDELEDELPARTDLPAVVDEAERCGESGATEQGRQGPEVDELAPCRLLGVDDDPEPVVDEERGDRHPDECDRHRQATGARHGQDVDTTAFVGFVDGAGPCGEPHREGGQEEGRGPGRDERGDDEGNVLEVEVHAAGNPGAGKRAQMSWTSRASSPISEESSRPRSARTMSVPTRSISTGPKPRVVTAGDPTRMPEAVFGGSGSKGIAFLLTVMPMSSRSRSASLPVTPNGVTSTRSRWLSVPPDTRRAPAAASVRASAAALTIVRRWSSRNASERASSNATALAAMMCMSGPPCVPGKTALSIAAGEARAAEHQAATRSAQRLVGRRRDDVGVRERARVEARGDEARDVRHVHHEQRVVRAGDLGKPLEVDDARVGAGARDDELRPDLPRLDLERAVVDALVLRRDAVGVDLVPASREVDRRAVGQVAAVGQAHAKDPVTVVEHRKVRGHVRLRARVRLDVDVLGTREQRDRALLRERLDDVDELAAPVVALPGLTLGVLVRQPGALGLEHRRGDVVLARDQLDLPGLPVTLADHRRPDLGIDAGKAIRRLGVLRLPAVDSHGHLGSNGGWCADASVLASPCRSDERAQRDAGRTVMRRARSRPRRGVRR